MANEWKIKEVNNYTANSAYVDDGPLEESGQELGRVLLSSAGELVYLSDSDTNLQKISEAIEKRNKRQRLAIAHDLEEWAMYVMRSNEYNFNDTAVRAKTFLLAADKVRNPDN